MKSILFCPKIACESEKKKTLNRLDQISSIIEEYDQKTYSEQSSELINTLTAIGSI